LETTYGIPRIPAPIMQPISVAAGPKSFFEIKPPLLIKINLSII
jgi:hypothetical protein